MTMNSIPSGKSKINLTIEMVNDKVAKFQVRDIVAFVTLSGSERLMSALPPKGGYAEIEGYLAPTPVKNGRYTNISVVLLSVQALDAAPQKITNRVSFSGVRAAQAGGTKGDIALVTAELTAKGERYAFVVSGKGPKVSVKITGIGWHALFGGYGVLSPELYTTGSGNVYHQVYASNLTVRAA